MIQHPLKHKLPLSSVPRRSDGRKSWSAFFALLRDGDQVRLPESEYAGLHSRANKFGARLRCDAHYEDRTFSMTVLVGPSRLRWRILEALSSLSDSKLTALYHAGIRGGIFATATPLSAEQNSSDTGAK